MFRGVANLNLDAKSRAAMPARFRQRLLENCGGQLIVTIDPQRCLLVYPLPEWERIERELMSLPKLHPQTQLLHRLLIGHATDVELDAQGRFLIPPPLREFAELGRRIVLIGQVNKFEIWDEDRWNNSCAQWLEMADSRAEASELPESLATLSY